MEKNPIKFRLMSTGKYVFVELDGKTLGPGITDLCFRTRDENGELKNQLELKVDLESFEFLPDGTFDEKYKKYQEVTGRAATILKTD